MTIADLTHTKVVTHGIAKAIPFLKIFQNLLTAARESELSDEEIDAMAEKAEIVDAMEHGIALF